MHQDTYKYQPSIAGLLFTAITLIVGLVYSAIAMNTGDLLWFWPRNDNQPNAIIVHCYGNDINIDPISNHYSEITTLVNNALSGQRRWDPLSLSEITFEEYMSHAKMMTLEVAYPKPIRIHTNTAFFSNVDMLLIPLDARHASKNVVFGRTKAGHPAAGSLFIDSTEIVKDYLHTQGICQTSEGSWWDTGDSSTQTPSDNLLPTQN